MTGQRIPAGEGISGHVLATGQTYVSNDVWSDPRFAGTTMHGDLRAVACVPLIAHSETIGALWVGRKSPIAPEAVRLLTAIAANALRPTTMHEQTERRLQRPALDIPYCHHEKWDGTGYPRGLKGEQIPLAARIFALVDVWDALRSDRPYRQGWPDEKVCEHIREQAGAHFDPQVVDFFYGVRVRDWLWHRQRHPMH